MLIGERFAWGHLPKTGGVATRAMLDAFPELIVGADPPHSEADYALFKDREDDLKDKLLVLNIRRLPAWILSHENHKARIPAHPHPKPDPISSPQQMSESALGDICLRSFTDDDRLRIDRWLRMEFLTDDLLALASELTDVTDERRRKVRAVPLTELDYDHEVHHWFNEERLERLYRSNPIWSAVEQSVYGNTLVDDLHP